MQLSTLHTVLGLELKVINDNEFSARYCIVHKHKNTLNISDARIIEGTLSSILDALPKAFPVSLTLSGKGIIHKNSTLVDDANPDQLFQIAFPTIEASDFYIQTFVQQQQALISMIRKQTADELISKMRRGGLNIFIVSLGAMVSSSIWNQLNSYGTEILFDGHVFELSGSYLWLSYQYKPSVKNEFQSKIGEQPIDEQNIIAYASAFQLLLHQQLNLICTNIDTIHSKFLQFTQNNLLKQKAMQFGIGLFTTLLLSYMVFSHYNDQNATLAQKLGAYTANTDQLVTLTKTSNENEQLLKQLNWNGGFNYGFLVNEIGESMPKQLQLLEININDVKSAVDTLTANTPHLKINGVTDNLIALNNWMFILKQKPWIKTVRLLKYEEDTEPETYKFNLMLSY